MEKLLICKSSKETADLGKKIGAWLGLQDDLENNFSMALYGNLGAGKTNFVQGLAKGLNISKEYYVTSPTFNIINEYPLGKLKLFHIDLYRISSIEEIEYTGFDDIGKSNNIIAVEWPQLLEEINFKFDFKIEFNHDNEDNRRISIFAYGHTATNLLQSLAS